MTLTDEEKLGAISIEIGIVDDHLDSCEKEGIEFLEAMKEEWKKLDELSLGFDTPTKTRLSVHKIGLKNIKKNLRNL